MTQAPRARSAGVVCRLVGDAADRVQHDRIRHAVFVTEQGVFADTDQDGRDLDPATLHVLGMVDGVPAGTVRLYPIDGGLWQGDRLAVLPQYRSTRLGGPLVKFAVATAGALGGERMLAHVQPSNERFFVHLGWTVLGAEDYVGRPHLLMEIPLAPAEPGTVAPRTPAAQGSRT